MKNQKEFETLCRQNGLNDQGVRSALDCIEKLESRYEAASNLSLDKLAVFCREEIVPSDQAGNCLIGLVLYFYVNKMNDYASSLLTLLGTRGVLESQKERMSKIMDPKTADAVFGNLPLVPLGTPCEDIPDTLKPVIEQMTTHEDQAGIRRSLAGNHHRIPDAAFQKDIELFKNCDEDWDRFLAEKHAQLVKTLETHAENGTLWFEQTITPEDVKMVRDNQEINTGVRHGNAIYKTKIPYNMAAWRAAEDPRQKRFNACHCGLVRYAIRDGQPDFPGLWCYCTGGFAKRMFDLITGKELKVEVLESVLEGDDRCRFKIFLDEEMETAANQE